MGGRGCYRHQKRLRRIRFLPSTSSYLQSGSEILSFCFSCLSPFTYRAVKPINHLAQHRLLWLAAYVLIYLLELNTTDAKFLCGWMCWGYRHWTIGTNPFQTFPDLKHSQILQNYLLSSSEQLGGSVECYQASSATVKMLLFLHPKVSCTLNIDLSFKVSGKSR